MVIDLQRVELKSQFFKIAPTLQRIHEVAFKLDVGLGRLVTRLYLAELLEVRLRVVDR